MFTNRLSKLFMTAVTVVVIVFMVQHVTATKASISNARSSYSESSAQTLREYHLGERYGETVQNSAVFSTNQIQREYVLSERYGVTPQQDAQSQAHREYWLGERYGQTP